MRTREPATHPAIRATLSLLLGIAGCGRSRAVPAPSSDGAPQTTMSSPSSPFPVVASDYAMTSKWGVRLHGEFQRRIENGSLVLWRPGVTAWINVWNNDRNQSAIERLATIRHDISRDAFDVAEESDAGLLRLSYRLAEAAADARRPALYGFAIGHAGHVQLAVYFDNEADLTIARSMLQGFYERTTGAVTN